MNTRTTVALALAAGFLGGIASQYIMPAPVWAQAQTSVPREIRAHTFVLVDEAGVSRGVFGFDKNRRPTIELMDVQGHTWGFTKVPFRHGEMLPVQNGQK